MSPHHLSRFWLVCLVVLLVALLKAPVVLAYTQPAERPMLLESAASERVLEEGRAHLYDFRLEEAEARFSELSERSDGSVAGTYHLAMSALFKGLISDEDEHLDLFSERHDALNRALRDAPDSRWRTYLEGEARFMQAIAHLKMNRNIRAAMSARSAYSRLRRAADGGGSFYEPYKGLGVFHMAIGSLPSGYQRILSLLGYSGTIEQGIDELRRAAEHSHFNDVEARAMLALVDIVINNNTQRGVDRLEELYEEFPESPFFAYLLGFGLLENREALRAEEKSRQAVERSNRPEYFFVDYAEYYLAESLFRQNEFREAETYYRRYLARHRGPALRAPANFHLAISLEMQGRRQDAEVFYQRVRAERDYDADDFAERHARRYRDEPITARERELVQGINYFYGGNDEQARAHLQSILDDGGASETERARAMYYEGRILLGEERYGEAQPVFETVMAQPGDHIFGLAPWSQFYIGRIHHTEGRYQEARTAYDAALDYRGPFDYHQWLEQVVAAAKEDLGARA